MSEDLNDGFRIVGHVMTIGNSGEWTLEDFDDDIRVLDDLKMFGNFDDWMSSIPPIDTTCIVSGTRTSWGQVRYGL